MLRTQHTTHIQATPDAVWAVLADVERWPDWTPTMRRIERLDSGPLALGSRARLSLRGLPPGAWRVTRFDAGRAFSWATETGLRVSASHDLAPDGDGTRLTLATEASGPLALPFAPLVFWLSRRNLRREALGLKRRCEQPAPA